MNVIKNLRCISAALIVLSLSACGGGGSIGADQTPRSSSLVTSTSANSSLNAVSSSSSKTSSSLSVSSQSAGSVTSSTSNLSLSSIAQTLSSSSSKVSSAASSIVVASSSKAVSSVLSSSKSSSNGNSLSSNSVSTSSTSKSSSSQMSSSSSKSSNPNASSASSVVAGSAPYDWNGIIGTGQSLHVGCNSEAISTTSAFNNLMLEDRGPDPKYPVDGSPTAQWFPIPLVEPVRIHVPGYDVNDARYPNNICVSNNKYGETPHSGFANTVSKLWLERAKGDYVTAHTVSARGSSLLSQISKADVLDRSYASGISEARVFKKLADQSNKTYGVTAILFTHGETDSQFGTTNYEEQLYQLWSDYNTDLKLITGQVRDLVIFASQQSSLPAGLNGPNVQLWKACADHPGKIVCVGPKYAYGPYGVHFQTGSAYERLGEKYGEVYDLVVNQGQIWKPLGPNRAVRSGNLITLTFDVPNPPMVWDSHLFPPHKTVHTAWANGNGFEVFDANGAELEITSATISGSDVVLALRNVPQSPITVAYALTPDSNGWDGGTDVGMHGLLRDSDEFVGYATEDIDVMVTKDSSVITPLSVGGFVRRAALDIVNGSGVAPDTQVKDVTPDQITLTAPWNGSSGKTKLSFHHNHYNFAVHFSMTVN